METEDFVNKLDKLNTLKKDGLIDDIEFEAQINEIKEQYSKKNNIYSKNRINNSTQKSVSVIGSLLFLIILIVGGNWIFSSGIVNDMVVAGKEFAEIFRNTSSSEIDYNYDIFSSNNYSSSIPNSNATISTPITTESKSSYLASCKNYNSNYTDMLRDPNSYKGLRMKFRGMVEDRWTRNGSTSSFTLSACTADNRHIGILYCTIDESVLNGKNLLQYDYINVYGEFKGITDNLYSIYGYLEYPHLEVKYIEFTSY